MSEFLNTMATRGMEFIVGLPTWVLIVIVMSLVMKFFGSTIKTIVKVVIFLFILSLLLSFIGFSLPSPNDIIKTFNDTFSFLWS